MPASSLAMYHRLIAFAVGVTVVLSTLALWFKHSPAPSIANIYTGTRHLCYDRPPVVSWNLTSHTPCDDSLCVGREKLAVLNVSVAGRAPRVSPDMITAYKQFHQKGTIDGWMTVAHLHLAQKITEFQHKENVFGCVGEVGVHMGLYFLALGLFALKDEPLVAIDLFSMQDQNFDRSGGGQLKTFLQNAALVGLNGSITVVEGNSMTLSVKNFTELGLPRFRLFSVDAGHAIENTIHDMNVAACILADGGVFVVDDVADVFGWSGVYQGLVHFMEAQHKVAPFLLINNKMYFSTVEYYPKYMQLISTFPFLKCQDLHPSRRSLGPHLYHLCKLDKGVEYIVT